MGGGKNDALGAMLPQEVFEICVLGGCFWDPKKAGNLLLIKLLNIKKISTSKFWGGGGGNPSVSPPPRFVGNHV